MDLEVFVRKNGDKPFDIFLNKLNPKNQARIKARLDRLRLGNLGDYKNLGDGIFELRFFFASGYRVYFSRQGQNMIILLAGGDKKTQNKDIKKAKEFLNEYLQK